MSEINLAQWFGLEDTAVVLAGAQGLIGRATATALRDCGAHVISLDLAAGSTLQVDLADPSQIASTFTRLDGLADQRSHWAFVDCAYPRTANWSQLGFENVTREDWDSNLSLHLGSAFLFSQAAVRHLKERGGGCLVHLGSIYGLQGPDLRIYEGTSLQNPVPYAAIKAGLVGLTRYIATVYGKHGIRANIICPGGIEDNQPEPFRRAYVARTPLGRMAKPEDIAGAVAFLLGPSGRYITGQVIAIDGGWTAW